MATNKDSLGDRMKEYEYASRHYLTRRIPAIIRVDGKAFHTFTRGMQCPFDPIMMAAMDSTMHDLCSQVQGCVLGYTQSDEITLVLVDNQKVTTQSWMNNNIQKMTSISGSIATLAFNRAFRELVTGYINTYGESDYTDKLVKKFDCAMFDSRVFSLPEPEVVNCLIWRQNDATRNSIEAAGQAKFSQKRLHKKSCNEIQDMLMTEYGINWNDYSVREKRGACCVRVTEMVDLEEEIYQKAIAHYKPESGKPIPSRQVKRSYWQVDRNIPIFTQDRDYVESRLHQKEE